MASKKLYLMSFRCSSIIPRCYIFTQYLRRNKAAYLYALKPGKQALESCLLLRQYYNGVTLATARLKLEFNK